MAKGKCVIMASIIALSFIGAQALAYSDCTQYYSPNGTFRECYEYYTPYVAPYPFRTVYAPTSVYYPQTGISFNIGTRFGGHRHITSHGHNIHRSSRGYHGRHGGIGGSLHISI